MAITRKVLGKDKDGNRIMETDEQMDARRGDSPSSSGPRGQNYQFTDFKKELAPRLGGQMRPRLAEQLRATGFDQSSEQDLKPRLATTGSATAEPKLSGVGDFDFENSAQPVFNQVNDDGLSLTLGMEQFGANRNSAQKFDLEGDQIFKGMSRPRKSIGLTSRRTQSSFGSLSPW